MRMSARAWVLAAGIAAAAAAREGPARAAAQEPADDLSVVKRAVAEGPAPSAVPAPAVKEPPPARRGARPQWFKVRVFDKGSKKARVTVNLPLAIVRAFGDAPVDWKCGDDDHPRRCSLKVADVLEALEAGQELVEVEEDDKTVKIWVE
jgi:hypothetical protein